ncbi:MAG: hypothetical protein AAFY34_13030 [Pseudomonadota bacterium]
MGFWTASIGGGLLAAALAALPQQSNTDQNREDPKILEEIETLGQQFEIGPQTGEFLIRPVMFTNGRGRNSNVRRVDLFLTPVEEVESGVAELYSEQQRTRYQLSFTVPLVSAPDSRLKRWNGNKIDLGTKGVDLPGGSYVLSEMRFWVNDPRQGTTAFFLDNDFNSLRRARSYCLTEQTLIFDVQNGKPSFLGALAIAPFPSNPARWRGHIPAIGVDPRVVHYTGSDADIAENIEEMSFDVVSLKDEPGICANRTYQAAAFAPDTAP